jgi:hypothetical protein
MSADISVRREVRAPETSYEVWATDGLDLSTDESYAAGCAVAQPPPMCAGTTAGGSFVTGAQWRETGPALASGRTEGYGHVGSRPA